MKNVLAGIMAAIITLMVSTICAEPSSSEAYDMVHEWAETYRYEDYLEEKVDSDGYKLGTGLLSASEFQRETGYECNIEKFIEWSRMEWDMTLIEVEIKGEIEGNNVYLVTAEAKKDLSWDGYKKCKILFMICE